MPVPVDTAAAFRKIVKEPQKAILQYGGTLRLLALAKFGSKEFWIYIYYKNIDKIKNPNIIPTGMELILPDRSEFDINAANPESIAKAKKLGDQELDKFYKRKI